MPTYPRGIEVEIKSSTRTCMDELYGLFIWESEMFEQLSAIHPSNITLDVSTPKVSDLVRLGPQATSNLHKWLSREPEMDPVIEPYTSADVQGW